MSLGATRLHSALAIDALQSAWARFRAANPAWRKLHLCRSACRVPAFGEFLDYLPIKCWDVVGLSAGRIRKRPRITSTPC